MRLTKNIVFVMILMLTACASDNIIESLPNVNPQDEVRRQVDVSFTASINDNTTRANAELNIPVAPETQPGISFTWEANESLAAYIKRADGSILYAGTVKTSGAAGTGTRTFSGRISELRTGEEYILFSPLPSGPLSNYTISYITQRGELNSTAHLRNYIPLVWRINGTGTITAEKQAYVIHLQLQFKDNPGKISQVELRTMKMGDNGTTPDKIFPTTFSTARLANAVNNTLSAAKTAGTTIASSAYTDKITFKVNTPVAPVLNKADVYITVPSVENLDVFRTKYNVEVTADNGKFYNDYRSMPGQAGANANDGLIMLTDGTCYHLTAKCSKSTALTSISDTYKVNSLLGMWNQYGAPYDPLGLIVYKGGDADISTASVPQQLKDNKTAILSHYQNNGTGTPTWLGATTFGSPAENSLYAATAAANSNNIKQDNVTINNIQIRKDTEVFVTVISEYGWNENLLGYYHYTGSAPASSRDVMKTLIFPNYSKPNHQPFNLGGSGSGSTATGANIGTPEQAPLREYETVKLLYTDANGFSSTKFPEGTTIGFMMMIDTEAQQQKPNAGYDLLKWSQWRLFTNTIWNKENTRTNGAAADWPMSPGYNRWNFFCSGDVCKTDNASPTESEKIPGLAIYGIKDTGNNDANTAYGAMIFMVSTSVPSAMETQNSAYFNIGTGSLVISK